jgi:hypothetical protein
MAASSACWAAYGELLAAQYDSRERMRFHQLIVDTYAVQHPDGDDRRAAQSVAIHLMTLCLFLKRDVDPVAGPRLHKHILEKQRPALHYLDPPAFDGSHTHLDVSRTGPASAARDAAYAWARAVWAAWSPRHATVRRWIDESGLD